MIKKRTIYFCITILLTLFLVQGVKAAGEVEYVLENPFTSLVPTFMSGHEGDPNWISGFSGTGNILLQGSSLGTYTFQVVMLNPPLKLTDTYSLAMFQVVNTLPGIGSYEVTAQSIGLSSSTTTTAGDITFAWSGSISNGTDSLLDIHGVSAGTATANIFTGEGSSRETIQIRFGY